MPLDCHACRWSRWRLLARFTDWVNPANLQIERQHGELWCTPRDVAAEAVCDQFEYEPGAAG
jgi:hypothetical protein